MRCLIARVATLYIAGLLAGQQLTQAQQSDVNGPLQSPCSASASPHAEESSGPDIVIADLSFWGSGIQMSASEQDQIATLVKHVTHGESLDGVIDEALERVREGWQDHGYFQVRVDAEAKTLTSSPISQSIALSVYVEEGLRYRLREITFKHNEVVANPESLRMLFPIRDGDVLSRAKIATGLENLKNFYGSAGYANFTSIPEPTIDDANGLISFDVDVDEGKQFFVREIKVLGLDEPSRQEVLESIPIKRGQIYNSNSYRLLQEASKSSGCGCDTSLHLDEKLGNVDIALDFRQCSNGPGQSAP